MLTTDRRYDIDWIRVIAIALLLIYHVAIGFQPWATMIGFIANPKPWSSLWIPMTMLNVWRIPLLFFVSGMGVYFALRNRNWKQLLMERTGRILVPFLAGMFLIVPIHTYLWQYHYKLELSYNSNAGHLWFLGNIFAYVVLFTPLFYYLKRNETGRLALWIKKVLRNPAGLLVVMACFVAEVILVNPRPFELYAMTWHGFFLGGVAFFFGFCFVLAGQPFRDMLLKWRWVLLTSALILFVVRITQFQPFPPNYFVSIESILWILAVLAFGYRYLNRGSKMLHYLSEAAYPVYILHMIFFYLGSMLIFTLEINLPLQFALVLLFTFAGCFSTYELIRRVKMLRPLFGLKVSDLKRRHTRVQGS